MVRLNFFLGNWLFKQPRKKFIIASKVRYGWEPDNPNTLGLSRGQIMRAVNDSLQRLQTDYIDLYQIHCWDYAVPIEETMNALNDLVREGKVRYLGASNLTGWQLQRNADLTRERGWHPLISLQQQYSLLCRETEFEVVEACCREGICLLPWSPLKGNHYFENFVVNAHVMFKIPNVFGWLTGKVKRNDPVLPPGSRLAWVSEELTRQNPSHPSYQQYANNDKVWNLLEVMEKCGAEHGKSPAKVAVRWLLQKEVVTSVVIGVKTLKQLEENLGAATGWELTEQEVRLAP
ncbi:hypothetical protein LSH36_1004g00012 [Paralvinella palmiformis]|uniref:NADP-dependent oxidoreductase domain-containing protein n=1 Tax=Paralvinella palmiformis TaxID=53620 RepID=A0AAD9IW36_9ANNE|nr:hypothetical protein LSH36_1004g00012 [Paralvinella palmiformis]